MSTANEFSLTNLWQSYHTDVVVLPLSLFVVSLSCIIGVYIRYLPQLNMKKLCKNLRQDGFFHLLYFLELIIFFVFHVTAFC